MILFFQKLSEGDSGDEEKQPPGPFESTALQSSPFAGTEKGDQNETSIKKFFEVTSCFWKNNFWCVTLFKILFAVVQRTKFLFILVF